MQQNVKILQALLICCCLLSWQHALELVDEQQTKVMESTESLDMEERPLAVTEYGKDMVTRKNPSDRDNGLKQMWEKVPADAPTSPPLPLLSQPPTNSSSSSSSSSQSPSPSTSTSKHMRGIK